MNVPTHRAPPEVIEWIHNEFRAALQNDDLIKAAAACLLVGLNRKADPIDNLRIAIASTVFEAAGVTEEEVMTR